MNEGTATKQILIDDLRQEIAKSSQKSGADGADADTPSMCIQTEEGDKEIETGDKQHMCLAVAKMALEHRTVLQKR